MVRTNGLAQTLSFFDAKAQGRGAQATAYALYQQCLEQAMVELGQWTRQNDNERLWRKLVHATLDMGAHMSMTRESLALAGWMKRFAVSVAGCDPDAATE
jgi:CRISPR type III-B/RAMP module-associated protein Cmr5